MASVWQPSTDAGCPTLHADSRRVLYVKTSGRRCALMLGAAIGCVVYVCSASIFWAWTPANIAASKSVGNTLIAKIQEFADQNKKFPRKLDDLVPAHLASIPLPRAGEGRWNYWISDDGTEFSLGFAMPNDSRWHGYPKCFYASDYRNWYLDE